LIKISKEEENKKKEDTLDRQTLSRTLTRGFMKHFKHTASNGSSELNVPVDELKKEAPPTPKAEESKKDIAQEPPPVSSDSNPQAPSRVEDSKPQAPSPVEDSKLQESSPVPEDPQPPAPSLEDCKPEAPSVSEDPKPEAPSVSSEASKTRLSSAPLLPEDPKPASS
jgi:hypothetical protein